MAPGVAQAQGRAVAEARVPDKREVDSLKLGQTQVLPPPRLDILDTEIRNWTSRCRCREGLWRHEPINYDRSPENMSQTEHVELLQTLTRLAGEGEKARPLLSTPTSIIHHWRNKEQSTHLRPLRLGQSEIQLQRLNLLPLFPPK